MVGYVPYSIYYYVLTIILVLIDPESEPQKHLSDLLKVTKAGKKARTRTQSCRWMVQ